MNRYYCLLLAPGIVSSLPVHLFQKPMHFDTLALRATHQSDLPTGAVVPPIHLSTTFARNEANELPASYSYARPNNPTREAREKALATLER